MLFGYENSSNMKRKLILWSGLYALLCGAVLGQAAPANQVAMQNGPAAATGQSIEPVSYASVSQLNGMLSQLEATSKNAQTDLQKLRIERWKTDGNTKKQALSNVDSLQRNLQGALPEIIGQLRAAPESVPASFKLYRNLDALYDVFGSVVELAGAFGSKDDVQSLSNDLNEFEGTRRQMADRIDNLSSAKESEIARLRTDLKAAQAAVASAPPPKKIVVDDNEPPKKPAAKKKTTPKKPATTDSTKPAAGQAQSPPAQQNSPNPQ